MAFLRCLQTAKEIECEEKRIIVSGYRNQDLFLKEELESARRHFLLQRKTAVLEQKEMLVDAIRENQIWKQI